MTSAAERLASNMNFGVFSRATELKKRLINRVLDSELTTHLGYDKHDTPPEAPPTPR